MGERQAPIRFDGIIFVYDVTDPDSLEELPSLLVVTFPCLFTLNKGLS